MKKKINYGLLLSVAAVTCITFSGCSASFDREMKTFSSNWGGGLNRTVTVYDYQGNEIKSYTGKFDVSESENEVYFDKDGKRIIIHGGIVINEEN